MPAIIGGGVVLTGPVGVAAAGKSVLGLLFGGGFTGCGGASWPFSRLGVALLPITGCIKLHFGMMTSSSVKYDTRISVGFCAVNTAPCPMGGGCVGVVPNVPVRCSRAHFGGRTRDERCGGLRSRRGGLRSERSLCQRGGLDSRWKFPLSRL